jgi:hypothetical protein
MSARMVRAGELQDVAFNLFFSFQGKKLAGTSPAPHFLTSDDCKSEIHIPEFSKLNLHLNLNLFTHSALPPLVD